VRAGKFLAEHIELRKRMLNELKSGPLRLSQFRDHVRTGRAADGWTSGSDVSNMLFHLQMSGDVMIVGHQGYQNIWGLSEKFLPNWTEEKDLTEEEFERKIAQRAIQALGTASPREISLVLSARPLSEPEEGFGTLAGGIYNTSSPRHRA